MTRMLKLRKPITVELLECDGVHNLTAAEWKLITAAVEVLDLFAEATTELSEDKYPTLSQTIPLLERTGIVLARHAAQSNESSQLLGVWHAASRQGFLVSRHLRIQSWRCGWTQCLRMPAIQKRRRSGLALFSPEQQREQRKLQAVKHQIGVVQAPKTLLLLCVLLCGGPLQTLYQMIPRSPILPSKVMLRAT